MLLKPNAYEAELQKLSIEELSERLKDKSIPFEKHAKLLGELARRNLEETRNNPHQQ